HGERFVSRCFTDAERNYAESAPKLRTERYAARFAAKEAVFKALGTGWRGGISWSDVGVVHESSGQPQVLLTGRCQEVADNLRMTTWQVSLTHAGSMAMASVIALAE